MIGINGMFDEKKFIGNKEVILLDSSIPIDQINSLIIENSSKSIITFDYDTHHYLEQKKIKHLISDDFLFEDDLKKIQSNVYSFTQWFNHDSISSYLLYENTNIGKLMFDETLDYFVSFLKKFWEIEKICSKNFFISFIAPSTLYEIGIKFLNSFKLIQTPQLQNSFAHDKVRLNFKIGNKHFMYFISKSLYKKLKNIFEKIVNKFLYSKSNPNLTQSLLVEFDTLKYQNFLLDSKYSDIQLLFYGRRRPAIWNLNSYSIVKNSNIKIITNHSLESDQFLLDVKKGVDKMNLQLDKLWNNSDFFNDFFCIRDVSFWNILHPIFITLLKNRLDTIIFEIELAKKFFSTNKIDNVLILSEIGFIEQIIISLAKTNKIPIILIQGGLYWDTLEAYEMNFSQGVYPFNSDLLISFGETQKIDVISHAKIDKNKIKSLGCLRYNDISPTFNDENYILLATTGPQQESVYGLSVKNINEYTDTIKQICDIATKNKLKLIIKQHPSPTDLPLFEIVKEINPKISIITTGDILDLIKSCRIMISIGISSVILEAQVCQKPVLALPGINYNWGYHKIFDSCLFSNTDNLERDMLNLFSDKKLQNIVVKKGTDYLNEYISNLGTGTKKILDLLKTI